MKASVKLAYIQRKLNLDDEKFSKKFSISLEDMALIRENKEVNEHQIETLCEKLKLDKNLFLDEDSIIYCKRSTFSTKFFINPEDLMNEEFPREDNARYEEKD